MADSPTTEYGFRTQSLGSNVNTWGDTKLNEALSGIAQTIGKILTISITGDHTITSTNYVITAQNKNAGFKFTGTLTGNSNITVPDSNAYYLVINGTTGGFSLTVKTASGTGVTIAAGRQALVFCDSTNVVLGTPSFGGLATPTTGTLDIAGWSAIESAIATAETPATAGTILVSGTDTTAGYTSAKIVPSGLLVGSTGNAGGNETWDIKTALYTASGTNTYTLTPSPALAAYASGNAFLVLFTNANTGAATLNVSGLGAKALTKNGASAVVSGDIPAGSVRLCAYDGTRFQLVSSIEATPEVSPLGLTLASAQTSGFTAAKSTLYPCTFSSSGTITFPSSATVGDVIGLSLGDNTKTYTLNPNGLKVNGGTGNIVLPSNNTYILTYNSVAQGWV